MTELGATDPEQAVRRPLLVRRLFDVLLEASGPVPAGDALQHVAELEPFTPHETSTTASGESRANNFLRFSSSWARAIGWLQKSAEGWELTSSGREALAALSDDDNLYSLLTKKYRQVQRSRRDVSADAAESEKVATLNRALDLVEEGRGRRTPTSQSSPVWPTRTSAPSPQRPTTPTGTACCTRTARCRRPSSGRTGAVPTTPREVLEAEGVEFDERGRASQAQRLTSHDLRDMLAEICR